MRPEEIEQKAVIRWAELNAGRWPELRLLYHVPNERKCTPKQGALNKALGVKSGVPDLVLPVARGMFHGLYIEMKRKKGGSLSPSQKWWLVELEKQGYKAVRCNGFEAAMEEIKKYLQEES